jgi:hypothetical protein
MRHPAASWFVDVSLFPKRSKDAAFTGNQDGCLHSVVARFQRASERGILPPVLKY